MISVLIADDEDLIRKGLRMLIGIGPKLALVPFLEITASLDPAAKQRVLRKMLTTAAAVAVALMVLGELLRTLLHFTIGSLSIAGGDPARARGVDGARASEWQQSPHRRERPDAAGAVPACGAVPAQPGGHRRPDDDLHRG